MQETNAQSTVILVVEDDESIAQVIELVLSDELGCKVTRFTHAGEALRAIEGTVPSLFILDYQLPSMTGLQLYDHIRQMKQLQHVPAIMMSANLPWREIEKRHISGLQKPFEIDDLVQMVSQMLGSSSPSSKTN